MAEPAIRAEGLSKTYRLGSTPSGYATLRDSLMQWLRSPSRHRREGEVLALQDVSFEVQPGEVVGFVGRNGAGKSTLLKILARITEPSAGRVVVRGRLGALLEVGTGFHPELTGRENVYLSGAILGMRRAEIARRFDEIVEFAELSRFLDTPVKHYSSGMYMRLAFAVAAHLEPEILLVDEVLAVGDAAFQRKCLGKMGEVGKAGRTVLFVSHNLAAMASLCSRTVVLDSGRVLVDGGTEQALATYLASVDTIVSTPWAQRSDRGGVGPARFLNWDLIDAHGTKATTCSSGDRLSLQLLIACPANEVTRNVHLSIWLRGLSDEPLCYLTTLVGGALELEGPVASVVCDVPTLPLQPGRYRFDLLCSTGGTLADRIDRAGVLDVVGGDFFGTGRLPPQSAGPLLIGHQFRCLAAR